MKLRKSNKKLKPKALRTEKNKVNHDDFLEFLNKKKEQLIKT